MQPFAEPLFVRFEYFREVRVNGFVEVILKLGASL
jgi:hypothetical protein